MSSTTSLVFVDTNVLIYARDRKDQERRAQARTWLSLLGDHRCGRLNLQVLNEFSRWVLKNESRRPLAEVRAEVDMLRAWGDTVVGDDEVELAWAVRRKFGFQWFDCLLVGAARLLGCTHFLSEDLTEGATFDTVRIVHPFRTSASAFLQTH
ncbi:MAG TPA: PIN domain-containing protein [Beijerinckiaceae bacterium]|nr:PIN domain-containing protein [Beijerinckiaceae bacterium]